MVTKIEREVAYIFKEHIKKPFMFKKLMKMLEIIQYKPQKSIIFLDMSSKGKDITRKLDECFLIELFLFL